jgi:hypothetical protein
MFSVINVRATCPRCRAEQLAEVQFVYGNDYSYEYKVGDSIIRGQPQVGSSSRGIVAVHGESGCKQCGLSPWFFDVIVADDRIERIQCHDVTIGYDGQEFVVLSED